MPFSTNAQLAFSNIDQIYCLRSFLWITRYFFRLFWIQLHGFKNNYLSSSTLTQ